MYGTDSLTRPGKTGPRPMFNDIRLHGCTDSQVEYYAIAAGIDTHKRYFFNLEQVDEGSIRFFAPGNEFLIGPEGIVHRGNGGSFCEYMFGIDQPLADLAKSEVINRLIMFGTHFDETSGSLRFSERTDGSQSFDKIFFDGNAVCNYFFFVHSEDLPAAPQQQQEELLKLLGKALKRSSTVGAEDDNRLIAEVFALLANPRAQFFLFKLIHKRHQEYRDLFRSLYLRNKKIADEEFARLSEVANRHGIDRYQQERIRIDVMYKHPDNRRIVDEYRKILIECHRRGEINKLENARLTRLKTLSVRNRIPGALFFTLDELLQKDKKLVDLEESDYLSETRQILEGLFLSEQQIDSRIDREDMLKLVRAKKQAVEDRNHSFEEMLLDASKLCDEKIRDSADISLLEEFSTIITYFDRFDATSSAINQLAFMENARVSEDGVRSLLGNRSEFDSLRPGLYDELFVTALFDNKYLGKYGRRKVATLMEGMTRIEVQQTTIPDLVAVLLEIDDEESLFLTLLEHVRERIRNFYSAYVNEADQAALKAEIIDELRSRGIISGGITDHLFQETILTIKKEAIYLHSLLPSIIANRDGALREDFLENSGLDLFYVEELEREYCEINGLDLEELYVIRKGLN